MALMDKALAALGVVPPSTSPQSTMEFDRMFDRAAKARLPFEREWVLDCAFFVGRQYVEWNGDGGRFQDIPNSKARPLDRAIANKIYSLVMDSYSTIKTYDPSVEVMPQSVDSMQVSNARIWQAYLDHITFPTEANWIGRRNEVLFWVALCGEGWLKWPMSAAKKRPDIEARSPFEVYQDPTPSNSSDCRWVIDVKGMDPEDVYDRYGVDLPATSIDSQDVLRTKILREVGMLTGNPTVTVKELWELPSRRHPEGRMVVWAANRILFSGPFPYDHKQLPFTQVGHSPLPGTAHYCSGVRIARPLQMELNQYHSQKLRARKNFNNFKVLIDSELELEVDFDNSDAQVIRYDSQSQRVQPPSLLQSMLWPDSQDGDWIGEELQDAVGIHDASQGQAPGRVDSATGIDALQEADKGRFSEVEDTLDIAVARGFGQLLALAKQYVPEDQIVMDYSNEAAPQVHRLKMSSLPDSPLLRVVDGAGLPRNRSARIAQITAMFSAGLFGPPLDPATSAKALKLLDFPASMNLTGIEIDEIEAQAENALMVQGIPVTPKPWQNHALHRRVHDEWRKTAEFASAPEKVWSVAQFHLDATDQVELEEITQEAKRQSAIQQIADAAVPPAPPDPSVPAGPGAPSPAGPPAPAAQPALAGPDPGGSPTP